MDGEEKPAAAEDDMDTSASEAVEDAEILPYIDQLVNEVESDGEEDDDISFNIEEEESMENGDVELEYDSDEDLDDISILSEKYDSDSDSDTNHNGLSEATKALLLWRLDKDESFSDWSIEVVTAKRGRNTKKVYHIHRNVIAIGPKKSGYFEALFKSNQFKESDGRTSEVNLTEDVASYIPDFLDYIYADNSECSHVINRNNWSSLHYLADYFIVPKLTSDISAFVQKDMHNNLEGYLVDLSGSKELPEYIIKNATKACAQMILSIKVDSTLLYSLSPAMFLQVITMLRSSRGIKNLGNFEQYHICNLVVSYIKRYKSNLDSNYFDAITRELRFPDYTDFAGRLAINLLEIMKDEGWEMITSGPYGIKDICRVALSKYLSSNTGPSSTEIESIAKKIPLDVSFSLLSEAFGTKRNMKPRKIKNISCKITSEEFGVPNGTVVEVSCCSNDSVYYIAYLLGRHLNLMTRTSRIEIWNGDSKLDDSQMVSKCGCLEYIRSSID